MNVDFDADSGTLRLDQTRFDHLIDWYAGETEPGPELAALRDVGAITRTGAHPAVDAALRAVTGFLCQMRVDLSDHVGEEKSGDGWVSGEDAALLLDAPDGLRELMTVHPAMLPAVIARLVRLGPRRAPDEEPVHMTTADFESLLGPTQEGRSAAAERFGMHEPHHPNLVGHLVSGPWRRWRVTMAWQNPYKGPASVTLQVIDVADGYWMCDVDGVRVSLWPLSATGVWRLLTLTLPDDDEVGPQPSGHQPMLRRRIPDS